MLDGKGREERKLPTVGLPSYLTVLGKEKVVNGLRNKLTDARTQFLPDSTPSKFDISVKVNCS